MAVYFLAHALSRWLRDLHLAAWKVECVRISLGRELAVHDAAVYRTHRFCVYRLASLYRALADARPVHLLGRARLAPEPFCAGFHVRWGAGILFSPRRGRLEFFVQMGSCSHSESSAGRRRIRSLSGDFFQFRWSFDCSEFLVELASV